MIREEQRIAFLQRCHLFRGLSNEQLADIAARLEERGFRSDEVVFNEGEEADHLYLIYRGGVRVVRLEKGEEVNVATLTEGDYFGEAALRPRARRSATVIAENETLLLALNRSDLRDVLKRYSSFKANLAVSVRSRRMAYRMRFKWLHKREVVYYLTRKHPVLLARGLIGPFLALVIPALLLLSAWAGQSIVAAILGGSALLLVLLWTLWIIVDWGNDYYIVTNQRVVWLERVVGIYDSRQEAPLSAIISVDVETDLVGRLLDYGDINVRTFVGRIVLRMANHPYQLAHVIEEMWQRAKEVALRAEKEAMKQAIRDRLGLPAPDETARSTTPEEEEPPEKVGWLRMFLGGSLFKARFEEGETITYRKHWIVLVRQTAQPSFFLFTLLGLLGYRLYRLATSPTLNLISRTDTGGWRFDTLTVVTLAGMIPFLLWWWYELVDWSNDIFQVTSEQILDVDRKPFGTVERRSAPLENILSTEYTRRGLLGYLFNFGSVYITVGATQLVFEDVYDPAGVQQDIDRRRIVRLARKKEAAERAERERIAEWLVTYHELRETELEPGSRVEGELSGEHDEGEME